jgi:hypothetical protein
MNPLRRVAYVATAIAAIAASALGSAPITPGADDAAG